MGFWPRCETVNLCQPAFCAALHTAIFLHTISLRLSVVQEYLGAYSADDKGNLVFHEGALVRAARNGDWVILDELNLAPTDVLEALNRLFDDNHELFIPELQETVKPHPQFMLFGTQNPAGAYAGVACIRHPGTLFLASGMQFLVVCFSVAYKRFGRPIVACCMKNQQQCSVLQDEKCCPGR